MGILDDAKTLWTKFTGLFNSTVKADAQAVGAALTATEQKYLPAFEAYCAKLESTLSTQGITILEQGLQDLGTVFLSGGNVTAAIAALVPQVVAQAKTDLAADAAVVQADARNAAYTAIGLAIAALPTATVTGTSSASGASA